MSKRKVIGATVGTTTSPKKISNELNPVKTVNHKAPDASGNVNIEVISGGGGGGGGSDGFSPIAAVEQTDDGAVIRITDKTGTTTATVYNGIDGYTPVKGVDYDDGTSVTVRSVSQNNSDGGYSVVTFSDGKTVRIKNGSKGSNGKDGESGVYVGSGTPPAGTRVQFDPNGEAYTVGDLLQAVIDLLPKYSGEVEDA